MFRAAVLTAHDEQIKTPDDVLILWVIFITPAVWRCAYAVETALETDLFHVRTFLYLSVFLRILAFLHNKSLHCQLGIVTLNRHDNKTLKFFICFLYD